MIKKKTEIMLNGNLFNKTKQNFPTRFSLFLLHIYNSILFLQLWLWFFFRLISYEKKKTTTTLTHTDTHETHKSFNRILIFWFILFFMTKRKKPKKRNLYFVLTLRKINFNWRQQRYTNGFRDERITMWW